MTYFLPRSGTCDSMHKQAHAALVNQQRVQVALTRLASPAVCAVTRLCQ
jgi:hypothetical protein